MVLSIHARKHIKGSEEEVQEDSHSYATQGPHTTRTRLNKDRSR